MAALRGLPSLISRLLVLCALPIVSFAFERSSSRALQYDTQAPEGLGHGDRMVFHGGGTLSEVGDPRLTFQYDIPLWTNVHARHHDYNHAKDLSLALWNATREAAATDASILKHGRSEEPSTESAKRRRLAGSHSFSSAASVTILYASDFGADPTGTTDSYAALQAALDQACKLSSPSARAASRLLPGIYNAGGVEVHLEGGSYALSNTLTIAEYSGNIKIHGGSLVPLNNFPKGNYLLSLSPSSSSPSFSSDVCCSFERITMTDLFFSSRHMSNGLFVRNSLRITIDNIYALHFLDYGLRIIGGHEVFVRNSFFGQLETAGGSPQERSFSGTGVSVEGNDHVLTDLSIFSAAVGVNLVGGANILTGVHVYNKAAGFGGVGMFVAGTNRIINSYIDYNSIVAVNPSLLTISNCFFYGGAFIILRALPVKDGSPSVDNLIIRNNMFNGVDSGGQSSKNILVDQSKAAFTNIQNVAIEDNICRGNISCVATKGSTKKTGSRLRTWRVNFSNGLVFPQSISSVQYSFQAVAGLPRSVIRSTKGNIVTIQTDIPVTGTLYVSVNA